MSDSKSSKSVVGTDWTKLLSDPELISRLGDLLKAYREAPADKREEALLTTMREIKARGQGASNTGRASAASAAAATPQPVPVEAAAAPPFEPELFPPNWMEDRRKHPRLKCFVAVELRVERSEKPVWGNLSNTSMGGCYIETAAPVHTNAEVEVGLWVASGKIWVKGMVLTGVVTKSSPSFGVRVKFIDLAATERESLKQFLKYIENTNTGYQKEHGYLAQLKR